MGPLRWYFDTSVIVAAAVARHPHNAPALAILEELVTRKHRGVISGHSLAEIYSVLTRTPFKPPLYPAEAWKIIEEMVLPHMELATLSSKDYQQVVRHCAANNRSGDRVHDVIHLRCATKTDCDRIYTFNVKDFRALASPEQANRISAP